MYLVSVGGMKMRGWSVFFRVIWMTYQALRAARAAQGCVHADIFREGRRYFAFSVWDSRDAMTAYARTGTHGALMRDQAAKMVAFKNHSFESATIPTRAQASAIWHRMQGDTA